eukprot:804982-Pelagomonas_calceolata.AAC.2
MSEDSPPVCCASATGLASGSPSSSLRGGLWGAGGTAWRAERKRTGREIVLGRSQRRAVMVAQQHVCSYLWPESRIGFRGVEVALFKGYSCNLGWLLNWVQGGRGKLSGGFPVSA